MTFPVYPSRACGPVDLAGDVSDALSGARRACTDVLWALAETGLYVAGVRLAMTERHGCAAVLTYLDLTTTAGDVPADLPDGDHMTRLLAGVGLGLDPHTVGTRGAQHEGCSCTWTVDPRDPWAPAQVHLTARLARCPSTTHTHHDTETDTCDPRGGDR